MNLTRKIIQVSDFCSIKFDRTCVNARDPCFIMVREFTVHGNGKVRMDDR